MVKRERRGFALVTVLAIIVGLSALGMTIRGISSDAVATTRNRVNQMTAQYTAEGCAAFLRAAIDQVLGDSSSNVLAAWSDLPKRTAAVPAVGVDSCEVRLEPFGSTLDVNTAGDSAIRTTLIAAGQSPANASRLVAALADWRDGDDIERVGGAEYGWYLSAGRPTPKNGRISATAELRLVRGFEGLALDSVLGVDSSRVFLLAAPLPVLATLPGFGLEVLAVVAQLRTAGQFTGDLLTLADLVRGAARDSLLAHYAEIATRSGTIPDAWVLTVTAESVRAGVPGARATVELKMVRSNRRAAVVRRRTW
jgi:type II secretory pathway component PulK